MRLIDADALMKRLKAWDTNDATDKALYNFALNRVLEAPTIEPERKTGQWIVYKAPDRYHCGLVKCPFCYEVLIAESNEYSYCPNCGAKMEGEADE